MLGFDLDCPLPAAWPGDSVEAGKLGGPPPFKRLWFCCAAHREAAGAVAPNKVLHELEGQVVCKDEGCTDTFLTEAAMSKHMKMKHKGAKSDLQWISHDFSKAMETNATEMQICVSHLANAAATGGGGSQGHSAKAAGNRAQKLLPMGAAKQVVMMLCCCFNVFFLPIRAWRLFGRACALLLTLSCSLDAYRSTPR